MVKMSLSGDWPGMGAAQSDMECLAGLEQSRSMCGPVRAVLHAGHYHSWCSQARLCNAGKLSMDVSAPRIGMLCAQLTVTPL